MTDLPSIIERLKAADGPSRELDVGIHRALGIPFVMEYFTEASLTQTENLSYVPQYSASLDATTALVERHGLVWLKKSPTTMTVYRPLTDEQDARKEWAKHFDAVGANLAIALLAALLTALQEQEEGRP